MVQKDAFLDDRQHSKKRAVDEAEAALAAITESRSSVEITRSYYQALSDAGISGREEAALVLSKLAQRIQFLGQGWSVIASALSAIPQLHAGFAWNVQFGGQHLQGILQGLATAHSGFAGTLRDEAAMDATMAGYERRAEEWAFQVATAEAELKKLRKDEIAAEIAVDLAQKALAEHETQLAHAKEVRDVVEGKFTNAELYLWMSGKLSETYFQAYQLAFDMARRAERAFQAERVRTDYFVNFGYWDGLRKGLLAGEQLLLDLRRMDAAYLETDTREFELTKAISLAEEAPLALLQLRESGSVELDLFEQLFDRDYPGHFLRRIKSVSVTVPAVTGPHTSVNCTLTLLSSKFRKDPLVGSGYAEDSGQDSRFEYHSGAIRSVCTSSGLNDAGLFELNFRDDRLLPFEYAGAISRWRLELPHATNRFDPRTLTDVVIQMQYTARDGGGALRDAAKAALLDGNAAPQINRAQRLYNLRTEFSAAWSVFEEPDGNGDQVLTVDLTGTIPYIPGRGAVRVINAWLAWDVDHQDAAQVALNALVTPTAGDPESDVTLYDLGVGPIQIAFSSPATIAEQVWTITVPQYSSPAGTGLDALAGEFVEATQTSPVYNRLKQDVFRDLVLVLELERDAPLT